MRPFPTFEPMSVAAQGPEIAALPPRFWKTVFCLFRGGRSDLKHNEHPVPEYGVTKKRWQFRDFILIEVIVLFLIWSFLSFIYNFSAILFFLLFVYQFYIHLFVHTYYNLHIYIKHHKTRLKRCAKMPGIAWGMFELLKRVWSKDRYVRMHIQKKRRRKTW